MNASGESALKIMCAFRRSAKLRTESSTRPRTRGTTNEEEGTLGTTAREVALLKELSHPNIVILNEIVLKTNCMYLSFE
ncbi:unnamed protein product [Gongylonema pulchrum]|uniref:Protein kinase domain-containing protein n=1 Tax=Gongylonema pulchrum TaxID=637853 RepID=A0A183EHC7_9BILA|nr:unnamed protein product [Gongylonema pulchrum]